MLRMARPLQPVNGLIVTVAADRLATASQDELRLEATAVRKRIDEAIRELGVNFPVYLLLTRCDLIEGFTTFFGQVPEVTHQQVFGYIHEGPSQGNEAPSGSPGWPVTDVLDGLMERLEQLRLAMFNAEHVLPATVQPKIFCFPEEFRALQQPLSAFVMALLAENPFQYRAMLRGLFLSSAQQQQTPISLVRRPLGLQPPNIPQPEGMQPYFLHDLFAVILRRDQYLATATRQARRGRWWRHFASVSSCLGLCFLLVWFLTQAFWNDRQVYAAAAPTACTTETVGQSLLSRLEPIETCRQVIETLQAQQDQRLRWSTWAFNRSGDLAARLRQRYVKRFTMAVLEPLDAALGQHLSAGTDTVPLVFVFMQRLELLTQCQAQPGCPPMGGETLQPDYQLMADPGRQDPRAVDLAPTLRQTYEAYVRWASETAPEALRREQAGHTALLQRWFAARQLALPQVLAWANQHYAPVRGHTYWDRLPPGGEKKTVQVEGAYTLPAWRHGLQPFLHRAQEAVPDMAPLLQAFQEEYRVRYFDQWRRFLAEFPRSETPWSTTRELRRRLAAQVLTARSPYNRIIDVVLEHVQPFLPAATTSEVAAPIPAWARTLQHYAGSESRQAYVEALQQLGRQVASDVPPEKSLALVQAGFQEGQPTAQSTHPVLKAWWLLERLRDQEGAGTQAQDQVLWPLLERPVRIGWKVLVDEAGSLLQKQWTANIVTPLQGLSDLEQVEVRYGPQGKVRAFAEQFTRPFLANNATRLVQVLGEEMPLAPGFFKALQDDRQLRLQLELGKATPIPSPVVPPTILK
jgi:type VI secretion system protein ImpL